MTTVTSDQERAERLEHLDAQAAGEWVAYTDRLRGLAGQEYEIAEAEAWDELQRRLADVDAERSDLIAAVAPPADDPPTG